jgi:hypothetical protein
VAIGYARRETTAIEGGAMKQSNKQMKKLVLETEKIKVLDPHRLGDVAGGVTRTYTCNPGTTNGAGG